MVVLSVAICTKGGKVIIGRQYIDMTRGRVEGLYSTFSKLIQVPQSSAAKSDDQFTLLETDTVRYLYQTLDAGAAAPSTSSTKDNVMYLVVVTTIYSNIVENVAVLQNLYKLVNYITSNSMQSEGPMTMMRVLSERFFDIVHAFDIVITPHGLLNESMINMNLINTILEMDSMDEKIAMRDEESKTAAARQVAKQKAAFFKAQQHANAHSVSSSSSISRAIAGGGISSSSSSSMSGPRPTGASKPTSSTSLSSSSSGSTSAAPRGRGLVLGGKKGLQSSTASKPAAPAAGPSASSRKPAAAAAPAAAPSSSSSGAELDVKIIEQLNVEMNQDATLKSMQIRGELSLCAQTESAGFAAVQLVETGIAAQAQFKAHPQIDKELWTSGKVVCGKGDKPFPVGHDITVLKWMYSGDSMSTTQPPLSVTCWPTASPESILMTIEYDTLESCVGTMKDVMLIMPLPPEIASVQERESDVIEIGEVAEGTEFVYDSEKGGMVWRIGNIEDADRKSGSIEFSVNLSRVDSGIDYNDVLQQLFPMHVSFEFDEKAPSPTSPLRVDSVTERHDASHSIVFSNLLSYKVAKYDIILNQF